MKALRGLTLLVVPVLVVGCSAILPSSERSVPEDELAELKRRVVELQQQAKVAEVELARLRRRLNELEARSGGSAEGERGSNSGAVRDSGRNQVTTRPIPPAAPSLGQAAELESEDLSAPPSGQPGQNIEPPRDAASPRGADSATSPTPPTPNTEVSPEAQSVYDRGYTLFHQGRYVDAESSFRQFLQRYAATDLADNAQYWIGESRYKRADTRGALLAFRETVERYPRGNKVADALYKAGVCLGELGDFEGARAAYDEVIRRFPASAAASLAEDRRRELE